MIRAGNNKTCLVKVGGVLALQRTKKWISGTDLFEIQFNLRKFRSPGRIGWHSTLFDLIAMLFARRAEVCLLTKLIGACTLNLQ